MVTCDDVYRWINVPNVRVVPCNASQFQLMKLYPDAERNKNLLLTYDEQIDAIGNMGCGWTVIGDGRCLAMFGVMQLYPGVAEAWLMVDTVGIKKRKMQLTKGAKRFFENVGPAFDLRRLHIMVSVAHKEAVAWARLLDFQFEATLKQYAPDGSDSLVYARFYD
jgi:hypothetical protein